MLHRKRTLTWYFLKMLVSVAKKVLTFSKKGVARISHSGIISPCRRARGAEANHWMWAFSSGGERFPDTEEVTSSNLVTPTTKSAPRRSPPAGRFLCAALRLRLPRRLHVNLVAAAAPTVHFHMQTAAAWECAPGLVHPRRRRKSCATKARRSGVVTIARTPVSSLFNHGCIGG